MSFFIASIRPGSLFPILATCLTILLLLPSPGWTLAEIAASTSIDSPCQNAIVSTIDPRRVGNLLFLSGVGPRERGTKKIPGVDLNENGEIVSYDIETQCRSVFQNVRYIVDEAGSTWNKIVDVTVFLTNMKDDFEVYNRVYAEYFADNQPCRTTVEVNRLPTPIAIELKVIAII